MFIIGWLGLTFVGLWFLENPSWEKANKIITVLCVFLGIGNMFLFLMNEFMIPMKDAMIFKEELQINFLNMDWSHFVIGTVILLVSPLFNICIAEFAKKNTENKNTKADDAEN